ncbi:MAG: hypothetical protein KF703_08310, partial [Actinobacteria bacterium]|nr:hypothetical protein [Actinomycetota bacterium]
HAGRAPTDPGRSTDQETTMRRTLFERVTGDRLGSGARVGQARPRAARDIDLDVARARHRAARPRVDGGTRPLRLF